MKKKQHAELIKKVLAIKFVKRLESLKKQKIKVITSVNKL
jgi:hypothetical protein